MSELKRRGFLFAALAVCAAPAIVRADSLMRVVPPRRLVLWGDGIHDDTAALQDILDGIGAVDRFGRAAAIAGGSYLLGNELIIRRSDTVIEDARFKPAAGFPQDGCLFVVRGPVDRIVIKDCILTPPRPMPGLWLAGRRVREMKAKT